MSYNNNGGLPLQTAPTDDVLVILQNNSQGQDSQGTATLAPGPAGYAGATIVFEKCFTLSDFNANGGSGAGSSGGIWTPLPNVFNLATNLPIPGSTITLPTTGPSGAVLNFTLPALLGYYAVRMRLATITSGSLIGSMVTFPAPVSAANPLTIASLNQLITLSQALVLAMSDMNSTDYLSAVGGSF